MRNHLELVGLQEHRVWDGLGEGWSWRGSLGLNREGPSGYLNSGHLLCAWNSPGKNIGGGSHSLLQGIFLTQGSNPGLLHCRQTSLLLSQQGSPRKWMNEWIRPWRRARMNELWTDSVQSHLKHAFLCTRLHTDDTLHTCYVGITKRGLLLNLFSFPPQ